jgi:type VII secretion-associated serine protease mycosin
MIRRGLAAATAMALAALVAPPFDPASAAAAPRPRSEEWWFPKWTIEDQVWPQTRGAGVTVAVIDSGADASLPGLRGVVLPGTDLDFKKGDGRTDTDTTNGGHGTAMTELIAGQGQDSGMVGVAPEAKILPIVAGRFSDNMNLAIRYAADHGAKVISISEGYPDVPIGGRLCSSPVQDAIAYAASKDVVVVAAAGNEGDARNTPDWPADCAGVLAVGAINDNAVPWTKTQRQPYVSVAAPGIQVYSVWKGGRFLRTSGTSVATALTSAAVALVRAKNPNLSARQVVQRVINTAVDAGPPGRDNATGHGVVIPFKAMTTEVPSNAANPPYTALDKYLADKKTRSQPTFKPTKPAASESSPGTGVIIGVVLVVLVLVAVVVILLLRRRGGGGGGGNRPPVPQQQPYYGGPPQGPPPGQYGGPDPRAMGPPPVGQQGPPPSFRPPDDRGASPR